MHGGWRNSILLMPLYGFALFSNQSSVQNFEYHDALYSPAAVFIEKHTSVSMSFQEAEIKRRWIFFSGPNAMDGEQ